MKQLVTALILFGCVCAGCSETINTYADITQYATDGTVIAKYNHVRIGATRGGWIRFNTADGKQITIDGPHLIEQR